MKLFLSITLIVVSLMLLCSVALDAKPVRPKEPIMDNPVPPGSPVQLEDGSVCWSAFTDAVWHIDEKTGQVVMDSQRVVGSGRIILPPNSPQEEINRHVYLMKQLAFRQDNSSVAPMSQSLFDIRPEMSKKMCHPDECGGSGIRTYPGLWDINLHWCLPCMGRTCSVSCRPTAGHPCPPGCP